MQTLYNMVGFGQGEYILIHISRKESKRYLKKSLEAGNVESWQRRKESAELVREAAKHEFCPDSRASRRTGGLVLKKKCFRNYEGF